MRTINNSIVLAGLCVKLAKEHNIKKDNIDVAYMNVEKIEHIFGQLYVIRLATGNTKAIIVEYDVDTDTLFQVIYTNYDQVAAFIKGVRRTNDFFKTTITRELNPALKKLSIEI